MKQYCKYCAHCIEGDCFYCTAKDKVLNDKQIHYTNKCPLYAYSELGSIIDGQQYKPRQNKRDSDVANGQLTIFDIEQDAENENNNMPKKKYRRCKYCQDWNMLSLHEQPHEGYGILGVCDFFTGRDKGRIRESNALSCCPNFKEWEEEPEWRKSLFAEKDESGYGKLAQYQERIASDWMDEEDEE